MPYKRYAANAFIAAILVLSLIDGLPEFGATHRRLKALIDPLMDKTGLWQGSWQLFAPEPQKYTIRLTAKIDYDEGHSTFWQSPDWSDMSILKRFTTFRMQEYVDYLGNRENAAALPALADYLARTIRHPEHPKAQVSRITITAEYTATPPPDDGPVQAPPGPLPFEDWETLHVRTYVR